MNNSKYCPVPGCKEDIIDRINKAVSALHTKINAIAKAKISKSATYGVAMLSVIIILGVSTIMYASYASARDERKSLIEKNQETINIVRNKQIEIKTKLDVELHYIKQALKKNEELSQKVLDAITERNINAEERRSEDR